MKKTLLLSAALMMLSASAALAQNAPVTVTVDANHGAYSGGGNYHSTYTSTEENGITLSCPVNNMTFSGSNLQLHSGTAGSSTYTIAAKNPDYYVSEFSFSAQANQGNAQNLSIMGGEASVVSTTEVTAYTSGTISEGAAATFILTGDNKGLVLTNFTVTIRPRVLPREDGWYTIQATHIGNNDVSYHVACANEEYRQDGSIGIAFYPLKYVSEIPADMPAVQFIRIDMVDATHMRVYTSNGHAINQNCTSTAGTPYNTSVAVANPDNGNLKIGAYWNIYEPADGAEKPYVGQGGRATTNTFTMAKADPEATYDIWTVAITGAAATAEVKDNARIVLNHEANKGLKKVYNNGNFFVTKGTALATSDFTADQYDSNTAPIITVDNEAKTVTVDYSMTQSSKSKCLELAFQKIDELYAPYEPQSFYANGIVAEAKAAAKAKITAAAGDGSDDAAVSDEIFQAVTAAVEAASTALAADVAAFNKSSVGTLIHLNNDRDGGYSNRLSVDADGNVQTQPKNNNLNEIWLIASCDEAGNISLQNYETGKYINSADNASATWTTVDEPNAVNGFFSVTPRKNGDVYPVDFHDNGSNNRYMHAKDGNYVIGWTSNATTYGSAWIITCAEADEVAEAITSAPSFVDTHKISFTHTDGLTLRSDITYLPCHNIVVTKIDTSAETETPQTRAADASFEPVSIAPTSLTECENGYTAELNTKLGEGTYEVSVPAAIFLVGTGDTAKMSKSYVSTFSVAADGGTTGIREVEAAQSAGTLIYDLQGRRLAAPVRGLNIINGRKVFVK